MEGNLSQSPKRPGARDISDLKARLGLKKSAPAANASGGAVPPPAGVAGVVPPPGVSVPPPPGMAVPVPNASTDPFAAMNAMAQIGALQSQVRAPEIIIVNDGKPVESVETTSKIVTYGKLAGMVLLPLIVGIVVGQISKSAKAYNATIADAAIIRDDVKRMKKSLISVQNALLTAKERNSNSFSATDDTLTEELAAAAKSGTVDPNIVYHSHLYDMKPDLVETVLGYYAQSQQLTLEIEAHVKSAKEDAKGLAAGKAKLEGGAPSEDVNKILAAFSKYRYGVFIVIPDADEAAKGVAFGARLVEIGPPICADRKASTTGKCDDQTIGFGYRNEPGEAWNLMELGQPEGEAVGGKKLIPLAPTGAMDGLLQGPEATAAEYNFSKRINDIAEKTGRLIEVGTYIEGQLNSKANEGKKFTFFL